jgi:hypothetical protein
LSLKRKRKEVSTWCPLSLHDRDLAGLRRPLRERDDNRQRVCTYNIREKGLACALSLSKSQPGRSIFFLLSTAPHYIADIKRKDSPEFKAAGGRLENGCSFPSENEK